MSIIGADFNRWLLGSQGSEALKSLWAFIHQVVWENKMLPNERLYDRSWSTFTWERMIQIHAKEVLQNDSTWQVNKVHHEKMLFRCEDWIC